MSAGRPEALVSAEWLLDARGTPRLRVVDASFRMPGVRPTAAEDYARGHIPGAVFFDIDEVSDRETALPHMLPGPAAFAAAMATLGIADEDLIIAYDSGGIAGAARLWWMLRSFGHEHVAVLDGGLAAWRAAGGSIETAVPAAEPARFTPAFRPELVRNKGQIVANLASRKEQVLDARAAARFEGSAPEPWPGRRPGHIPGALSLDHARLVDPASGRMKPAPVLAGLFHEAGLDLSRPVATSCGSGITACVLALALYQAGRSDAAVYDGSWAEWGLPDGPPVETGPARRQQRRREPGFPSPRSIGEPTEG